MPDGAQGARGTIVGAILVVLGVVSVVEGIRLYALRTQMVAGAVVGDDTFPLIIGVALIGLGVAAVAVKVPTIKVELPAGAVRRQMLAAGGILFGYWLILPYLGYTASTALVSTGLFRAMGRYRWRIALLLGGVTTALLYLLFRVWLLQPLPTGWLGG